MCLSLAREREIETECVCLCDGGVECTHRRKKERERKGKKEKNAFCLGSGTKKARFSNISLKRVFFFFLSQLWLLSLVVKYSLRVRVAQVRFLEEPIFFAPSILFLTHQKTLEGRMLSVFECVSVHVRVFAFHNWHCIDDVLYLESEKMWMQKKEKQQGKTQS